MFDILKVYGVFKHFFAFCVTCLCQEIVISSDAENALELLFREPAINRLNLSSVVVVTMAKVAAMDENITRQDPQFFIHTVGVADQHESQPIAPSDFYLRLTIIVKNDFLHIKRISGIFRQLAAMEGALSSIFDPALQASLPLLTEDSNQLQASNALLDVTGRLECIFAPALAGLLITLLPVNHTQ